MRSLLVIALSCFMVACAQQSHVQLYPGTALPEEQILSVVIPNELEVQSINGQRVSGANAMFGIDDKTLHLQPGKYQINAFYKKGFDIDGGMSHEVVRGRTGAFTIDGKAGEQWKLEFERPATLQEAKALETEFRAWAVNTRTGERYAAVEGQRNTSLVSNLLGTGQPDDNRSTVAPLGAAEPARASAYTQGTVEPLASSVASETLPHNDATLTTLKQLWHLMSPESRAAFMEWAAQ